MEDKEFNDIVTIISDASSSFSFAHLTETISEKSNFKIKDIDEILNSVLSLITLCERQKGTIDELVKDISNNAKDIKLIDADYVARFSKRLTILLNNEHLFTASKAIELATDYENIYSTAKIITDVRPVFNEDISGQPKSAVIIHNLDIHYHKDSEVHKDIYIAMDSNDIKELLDVLQRAQKKEEVLLALLTKTGIENIKLNE